MQNKTSKNETYISALELKQATILHPQPIIYMPLADHNPAFISTHFT